MTAARGRRTLTSWLAFAILLAAVPAVAGAGDKTIVLLGVEGEQMPRLRMSLERIVKTEHEILQGSVYRDAARRLRAKKLTPNNVMKVCAYLKVDGVIDGTVVQEDDTSYRFIVRVRSAASGIIEKKIPMRLAQPRLSEEMANQLAQRLMLAINDLPEVDKDGQEGTLVASEGPNAKKGKAAAAKKGKKGAVDEEDADEEVAEKPTGKKGKAAALASKSGKGKKRGEGEVEPDEEAPQAPERLPSAREEEEGDGPEDDEDGKRTAMKDGGDREDEDEEEDNDDADDDTEGSVDDEADLAAGKRSTPRTTPVLVNVGVSFVGRKLSFSYSGTDPEQAPPGFSGTPVPGAYVVGEVYPALLGGTRGVLADVGVGFVIDRVIKLNAAVEDEMGTVNLATRMWRYGANLRYRHNFGPAAANGFSVQASLGYNSAGFAIDKAAAPGGPNSVDVPNVNYKYIDAGLGGRIPIGDKLSFLAEAKFLAPLSTGQIQSTDHYGGASIKGVEGEGALEYQITGNILARAGGRLMLVSYSFDGNGALDDRDGDAQQDVSGASDRYLGGFVTGGYLF